MSKRVLLVLPALLVLLGTPVAAQNVRVRSEGAVLQPAPAAIKVAYERLKPGTVLEIIETTDTAGGWLHVRVVGTNRVGYVRRNEVEPIVAPPAPGAGVAQKPPAAGATKRAKPAPTSWQTWLGAGYLSVSGIYQGGSSSFTDSFSFPQYVEQAQASATYPALGGAGADGAGWFRIWKGLGAGVSVSWFAKSGPVAVDASIPHPFYPNRGRHVAGSSSVRRDEVAAHVQVGWVITAGPRLVLTVEGGPSWFSVKQDVVEGVRWSESYPYDTATFAGSETARGDESAVGYNVGLDVGYYFSRNFGVGGLVRFSRAQVPLASPSDASTINAGGVQVGIGLRVRFPPAAPPAGLAGTGVAGAPPPRPAGRSGVRPQPPPAPPPLTGIVTRAQVESFDDVWKTLRAEDYEPDPSAVATIRQKSADVEVFIVLGTWSPDVRRDLPRFLKIADRAGWSAGKMTMLAVDRTKRDPEGQTAKWDVSRVPTFIFLRGGREIGRIVERPTTTLEQDIAGILSRQ